MSALIQSQITINLMDVACLLILLYLLSQRLIMTTVRAKAFTAAIFLTIFSILAELATTLLDTGGPIWAVPNFIANIVGFSCSSAIPYLLSIAYYPKLSRKLILLLLPSLGVLGLGLVSISTGWFFSVSAENVYTRGPLFLTYMLVYGVGLCLLFYANRKEVRQLSRRDGLLLSLLFWLSMAGVSVQVVLPTVHSSWHCVTLLLTLYYIFQRELQFCYDMLTGVLNRSSFDKDLQETSRYSCTVLVFDLDNFKTINDSAGHLTGDACLACAASILQESFREIGSCYRIGGDEFSVLARPSSSAVLEGCIHRMLEGLLRERTHLPQLPHISYGYSSFNPALGEGIADAVRRADENMYRYKKSHGTSPQSDLFRGSEVTQACPQVK